MSLNIEGRTIERVVVVDDDAEVREQYGYPFDEMGLKAIYEPGPLRSAAEMMEKFLASADALICDFHLRVRSYSPYNGDQLVALANSMHLPALLCSSYDDADITVLRSKRQFIPELLRPSTYGPDTIARGLLLCIQESAGQYAIARRPWRTLVRVVELEKPGGYFYVVVPGWNSEQKIRTYFEDVPEDVRPLIEPGRRLFAQVNIGAENSDELYFYNWGSK